MKLDFFREILTKIGERMGGLNSSNEKDNSFEGKNRLLMVFIY